MKYSIVIVKKPNAEKKCPVKIKVTHRATTYFATGVYVLPSDWNDEKKEVKRSEPKHLLFNNTIRAKYNEVEKTILELQMQGQFTLQRLRSTINKGSAKGFYEFVEKLISEAPQADATIGIYKSELKRIRKFAGDHLNLQDIDHSWLRRYQKYLNETVRANNTRHKAWKILRRFCRVAFDDKILLEYPFAGYKGSPKYIQTKRTYLLWSEVEKIEALLKRPLTDSMRKVVLFFLLGCYTSLRIQDWLLYNREGFVEGDRFITAMDKTGEIASIKINPGLQNIIDLIGEERLNMEEQTVNDYLKSIAVLAGINKVLTTHVARHTFGTHCARLKAPDYVIAKLMGISVKTAKIYTHLINTAGDEFMDKWNTG